MSMKTFSPPDTLKPFVKSVAISRKEKARNFNVLPDTGILMGFQYSGNLSYTYKSRSVSLGAA